MSWLKLNDSLNSIKGQLSNFASNVLADDEESEIKFSDFKELKQLCVQQELEIQALRATNEELNNKQLQRDEVDHTSKSWNWDAVEQKSEGSISDNTVSDLKNQIKVLENEKNELLGQLEQLDSENQLNLAKVVDMKDKIQEELDDLHENFSKLKQQNKSAAIREETLRSELKQLQEKLEERKITDTKLDDDYRDTNRNLQLENQKLRSELEELKTQINVLDSSHANLQKVLDDIKIAAEKESAENSEKLRRLEVENKVLYSELQKVNEKNIIYEKKSLEDEDNCMKLANILETYEKQVGSLKEELEELKAQNEILQANANIRMDLTLEEELEEIKKDHESQLGLLQKELDSLKIQDAEKAADGSKLEELELRNKNQEARLNFLQNETDGLKKQNEELICSLTKKSKDLEYLTEHHKAELLELHNKYVNIITENIKKIQDYQKASDVQHGFHEDGPQIAEFTKQVENILKILVDLKCKSDSLEKKVYDLSEEKTQILTEKNFEIEKLMKNSEILSQEIIMKTQTLKHYEEESSELAKNNDLLINKLQTLESNPSLQTISESNEENLVIMESQLENAHKRIEDLERIIDDLEKQQQEKTDKEIEFELGDAMKQLNLSETEIVRKDYQELLNSFDHLQIEYDTLKNDAALVRGQLKIVNEENILLKSNLEKIKSEYENIEYQLSEMNINTDSLKDEADLYKKKIDMLIEDNDKLQMINEECLRNNEDLKNELKTIKEQLIVEEDGRKNVEIDLRNLTEKLQNSKMTETSLKLQYDTLSKEVASLLETKHNLEGNLNRTHLDLAQFQANFSELQFHNDKVLEDYIELKQTLSIKEKQIQNFEILVEELQSRLQQYEKLAVDENEELFRNLSVSDSVPETMKTLRSNFEKYEDLAVEEDEKLFKKLSISESENQANMDMDIREISKNDEDLKFKFESVVKERNKLQFELDKLAPVQTHLSETLEKFSLLQQQLQEITNSRNELINIVTTKHQENVAYHNEIQRLSQYLTSESDKCKRLEEKLDEREVLEVKSQEIEKLTDQNNFLKEKCEVMAKNLLEEQSRVQQLISEKSNLSEKELTLQKKLDRLQSHLIELEEHYTQELLHAEQKNAALQTKVTEIEEREKSSSTKYTSVSIRANQQVESLQSQLQMVVIERDALRKQISDAEDQNSKQGAALANLQFVLEQFRKDKEKDVQKETERIRRHINIEKQIQEELRNEISSLKSQLEESKQGLLAASRLSDQLEYSKKTIAALKDEASQIQAKLLRTEEELEKAMSQTDGKVDKSLIKNLIVGFVTSNNNMNRDQIQILKIIATVLDFNQQDHEKVNLNKPQQGSWLVSLLAPPPGSQNMTQESLSQAFVKFLENESKPRVVPSLLNASSSESTKSSSSKTTTPRQSPIVLSEIVLPTFADFAQNRNSSSILKDVLKDNS